MDNLKPYAEYKASGADWLGDIPKGWEVKRLGIGYNITLGKMLQPMPKSDSDISVPYYRALNVQWEEITNDVKEMWASPEEVHFFSIEKGDLLVCEGGEVGRASIVNSISSTIIFQNALHRVRAKKGFSVEFLLRVLEHVAYSDWFSVLCNKATIAHFTSDKFKSLICAFPPLPEQQAIVNFLDQNCARIDSLIKKKQQFLELLEEKRRTLITHAVTRGLDASAPLKASGVDWLGDIPKGWEVKRLKFVASCLNSNVDKKSHENEQEVLLCNYVDVYKNEVITNDLNLMKATASTAEIAKFSLNDECVVITKDSESWTDIAVPAFVPNNLQNVVCGYHLAIIKSEKILAKYIYYMFKSPLVNQQYQIASNGVTRFGLPQSSVTCSNFIIPPLPEQQTIVDYLDTETATIDKQKKHVQASIELLKEYRASLITHAVTGKIDVRDMVTQ